MGRIGQFPSKKKSVCKKLKIARRARGQKKSTIVSSITSPPNIRMFPENQDTSAGCNNLGVTPTNISPQPGCSHWNRELEAENIYYSAVTRPSTPEQDQALADTSSVTRSLLSTPDQDDVLDDIEIEQPKRLVNPKKPFTLEGRRIVDIQYLLENIKELNDHGPLFSCSIANMIAIGEKRKGLESTLKLKCAMCNVTKFLPLLNTNNGQMNINEAITLASISTGIGYSTADEIMSTLNIPFMATNTYQSNHEKVGNIIRQKAWDVMEEAAKQEGQIAKDLGEIDKETQLPYITVVADGAWGKRSYNVNYDAASGAACIIGARTKKLLYLGVRNKYCTYCTHAVAKNVSPIPDHACYKNWSGTSTGMESDIICEGFKQSMEMYGLIYLKLVGDGDSSVHKKLIEKRPYGPTLVHKIECRNHLLRNFCAKIRDVCAKKRSASTNSPVPPLLRNVVSGSIIRLRTCIKMAVNYRIKQNIDFLSKVDNLTIDIKNVPYHVFGDHTACEERHYFKCSRKGKEDNYIPSMQACGLLQDIDICLNRLVHNAASLIHNMDNNLAESYNSIICKFVGGKRIHFSKKGSYQTRCEAAAISFNLGSGDYHLSMGKAIGKVTPKGYTKKFAEKVKVRRSRIKRKRLFTKKTIKTYLPDKDYGPEANAEPDLTEEQYEIKKKVFLTDLIKSEEDILLIERETRGQSANPLWKQERSLRLTASNFGTVCKLRKTTSCENTVKNLLYSKFMGTSATKYGTEKEPIAIKQFEQTTNKKVKPCGLFIHREHCFLAASPDGLIEDDGIIEVKCPSTAQKFTPEEAIQRKKITCATINDGELQLKRQHNYHYQIQGQLHVTNRQYCYFMIWTSLGFLLQKIDRDDLFWKNQMEPVLQRFYLKCLLPEIIDPRFTKGLSIRNPPRD